MCVGCLLPAVPQHCCRCGKAGVPCVPRARWYLCKGEYVRIVSYCGVD